MTGSSDSRAPTKRQKGNPPSAWTTASRSVLERYPEVLHLSPGVIGAARLEGKRFRAGGVTHFEWEPAVAQREDIRIRPHPLFPPVDVFPATASGENEAETLERHGDPLDALGDFTLLEQVNSLLPNQSLHPTILLNSVLRNRPKSSRLPDGFDLLNPNFGNCLSVANTSETGDSFAAWRCGDSKGRPTTFRLGSFRAGPKFTVRSEPNQAGARRYTNNSFASDDEDAQLPSEYSSTFPVFAKSPLSTFPPSPSPILQITSSALSPSSSIFAIRTQISLSLLQTSTSTEDPIITNFTYSSSDFGRNSIADVALGGVNGGNRGNGMVIDDRGGLWGWGIGTASKFGEAQAGGGKTEMFRLRKSGSERRDMGKVVCGGVRGDDAVVANEKQVLLYDLRSPRASSLLLGDEILERGIPPGGDQSASLVTSLASPSTAQPLLTARLPPTLTPTALHVVCTTRDIVWLDDRMPGKDLMRWSHDRLGRNGDGIDRTLSLLEFPPSPTEIDRDCVKRIALYSRIHPLVTIYSYSSNPTTPPRSLLDPYSIQTPSPGRSFDRTGLAIVPAHASVVLHDETEEEEGWMILESASDGRLFSRVMTLKAFESSQGDSIPIPEERRRCWSDDVASLAEAVGRRIGPVPERNPAVGGKQKAKAKVVRLSKLSEKLFEKDDDDYPMEDEGGTQSIEKEVENVAAALRLEVEREREAAQGGSTGALTGFDLLNVDLLTPDSLSNDYMDVDENALARLPHLPRPSTFLSSSGSSVCQKPLPLSAPILDNAAANFESLAPWSLNLTRQGALPKRVESLTVDTAFNFAEMASKSTDLQEVYGAAKGSLEAEACDQLVLDTTLASRIYSSRPLLPIDPDDSSEHINQPLPPELEPPPLHFSYFNPQPKAASLDDGAHDDWKKPSLESVGARMLLSEWKVASDPLSYSWSNPYVESEKDDEPPSSFASNRVSSNRKTTSSRKLPHSTPFSSQPSTSFSSQPFRPINTIVEESPVPRSPFFAAASQPTQNFSSAGRAGVPLASSPAFGASQIFPGAFGGRPLADKKKPPKKRVSGF